MTTPYPQSYILAMECGAVYRWTGLAEDSAHGEGLARSEILEHTDSQVWDMCAAPLASPEFERIRDSGESDVVLMRKSGFN